MTCNHCHISYPGEAIQVDKNMCCIYCGEKVNPGMAQLKEQKKHRVLILGIDGYIGWSLAAKLLNSSNNYEVCGLDNLFRRKITQSLTPIKGFTERERYLRSHSNFIDAVACFNLHDYYLLNRVLKFLKPDTIVHLAEQPSAPWSMKSARESLQTQLNNVCGTLALLWAMYENCPDAHLIKLGTMGEYGTPNCDIPEGDIPKMCLKKDCIYHSIDSHSPHEQLENPTCPMAGLLFPRQPGSFYHVSKVQDTYNIDFACRNWGLRSTDIMQGVVFGLNTENTDDITITRFDYDQYFGTAINRFCVQAICNYPLSIYGGGRQARSFLPLKDSLQCLQIAIDNPPEKGEYRTFNQFESVYRIKDLAFMVYDKAVNDHKLNVFVEEINNPRYEVEDHHYSPSRDKLTALGYVPTENIEDEISNLIRILLPLKYRVDKAVITPTTKWK